MPVTTNYAPITFAGDGIANAFAVVFPFQLQTDLVVTSTVVATGVATVLVLGTDYIVTPTSNSPANTGTVTTTVAVPTGTDLTIARSTPVTQLTTWVPNDPNLSTSTMNAVDKLTMEVQELSQGGGVLPDSALAPGTSTTDTFLRGGSPRAWSNTLVGPSGGVSLAADTTALFTVQQSANASIRVGTAAGDQASYSFAVGGSANPWEMKWVYDDGLGKLGWQVFGQSIRGTFDNTGLDVSGTVNATLFTGAADGSLITTGTIDPNRLGSGSPNSNKVLYGDSVWRIVSGGGGGINTTTTGTFVIAAVNSSQTVPVTSATGIVAGTYLQISDGTHTIIGHVTVVASLNLTVVTDSIVAGSAGNTMASGAAVQSSTVPGNNTIFVEDGDSGSVAVQTLDFTGSNAGAVGNFVKLFIGNISGPVAQIEGYIDPAALSYNVFGASGGGAGFVAYNGGSTSTLLHPTAANQVPICTLFAGSPITIGWGLIGAANITPASLTPALLNCTNSLTDTELFGYDSASGHFKMFPNPNVGSGTTAQFYRGDNTFTNSLTGPINIDLSSSTTFRIGVANIFGGSTPVQAYMEPVVSGTPTVLPLQIASQLFLGSGQYNTIDSTTSVEFLQVNGVARATSFRSTGGPWNKIFDLAGGGAVTIDLVNGNYQRIATTGSNTTITLADTSPLPSAQRFATELTLEIIAPGAFTYTWPGTVTWANGNSAPTLSTTGTNIVRLIRRQDNTQWIGYVENPPATGSGTVTSITAGSGLSGGTITTSGTIAIATGGVTASLIANNTITAAQISATANFPTSVLNLPGGTANFLRADGSWAVPPGTGGGGGGISPNNPNTWTATQTYTAGGHIVSSATNSFTGLTTFTHPAWTDLVSPTLVQPFYLDVTGVNNGLRVQIFDSSTGSNLYRPISSYYAATNTTRTVVPNGDEVYLDVRGATSGPNVQFTIAETAITQTANSNSVDVRDAIWFNSWGPCIAFQSTPAQYPDGNNTTHSQSSNSVVRIGEVNYGNAWSETGFVDDRGFSVVGATYAGMEFFPDWLPGTIQQFYTVSPPTFQKFNAQWAISIGYANQGSIGGPPKNWIGLLIAKDGIAPGGIAANLHGGTVATVTTGTFTIAAVGSSQTVAVSSVSGISFAADGIITATTRSGLQVTDGTHTITGHVTNVSSLNLTFVTDSIIAGSAGNTMGSAALVNSAAAVGINFENAFGTGINFAGSAGGAPVGTGGGTAASFTSTGNAAITMADDQSIKLGSIWLRGHSGALQYSTNGTSWTNVTLP